MRIHISLADIYGNEGNVGDRRDGAMTMLCSFKPVGLCPRCRSTSREAGQAYCEACQRAIRQEGKAARTRARMRGHMQARGVASIGRNTHAQGAA